MRSRILILRSAVLAILATGCGYLGSARPMEPAQFDSEPGWIAVRNVAFQRQTAANDCGAASVAMVLTHWGIATTPESVLADCPATEEGMKAGPLRDLIRKRGLQGYLIHGTLEDLKTELSRERPVIVGLVKPYVGGGYTHYEVIVGIHPERKLVATLDPAAGPRENTYEGFMREWEPARMLTIVVLGSKSPAKPGAGSRESSSRTPTGSRARARGLAPDPLSPLVAASDPDERLLSFAGSGARQLCSPRDAKSYIIYGWGNETSGEVTGARFRFDP